MVLLVIDMQTGLFTAQTPRFDDKGVVKRINCLSAKIRLQKGSVIFIQHDGPKDDPLEPHTKGWQIRPDLDRQKTDILIRKTACDAFYKTDLLPTLKRCGEKEVIVTGCATDFCVDTTIRSAASKDLEVTVAKDAHTTADRDHLTAPQIIAHHNFTWENLILPHSRIRVKPASELLKNL